MDSSFTDEETKPSRLIYPGWQGWDSVTRFWLQIQALNHYAELSNINFQSYGQCGLQVKGNLQNVPWKDTAHHIYYFYLNYTPITFSKLKQNPNQKINCTGVSFFCYALTSSPIDFFFWGYKPFSFPMKLSWQAFNKYAEWTETVKLLLNEFCQGSSE